MSQGASRSKRGGGSRRERRAGVWEIRVTTGIDPTTERSVQTSFTHHGDADSAERRQAELVEMYGARTTPPPPQSASMTVQALLEGFLAASHRWSATTWRSHRGQAAMLCRDRIRGVRLDRMTPNAMEAAIERWARAGVTAANLCGRFKTLHSAISWAVHNELLVDDPLAGVSCPTRPAPRLHLRPGEVRRLLLTADALVEKAEASMVEFPDKRSRMLALFRAEQNALLIRLAADSAARRGELVALKADDLVGRKLSIWRASQDGVIGPVKNHLQDSMTLGVDTATYWATHLARWRDTPNQGVWLFSATPERRSPLLPNGLGQRFEALAAAAGIPDATLHRLRHTVGTYLVAKGEILKASKRLRHRYPATTLNEYAHAVPLDDQGTADMLAALYGLTPA
jgi:integrase